MPIHNNIILFYFYGEKLNYGIIFAYHCWGNKRLSIISYMTLYYKLYNTTKMDKKIRKTGTTTKLETGGGREFLYKK